MKCPYCNNEMQIGYVQCRDGIYWTPKKQLVAAFSAFAKGSTCLDNSNPSGLTTAKAYNCVDCKKVIIDYSPIK